MSDQITPSIVEIIKEQSEVIGDLKLTLEALQQHYIVMAQKCDDAIKKAEDALRTGDYIIQLQDANDILDITELQ